MSDRITPPGRQVRVSKGWGYEHWYTNGPLYCAKILHVFPGKRGSYHYHLNKDETFVVLEGKLTLMIGSLHPIYASKEETPQFFHLTQGETFHLEPRLAHQIINEHSFDLRILEISTHHDDEDSYRLIKGD